MITPQRALYEILLLEQYFKSITDVPRPELRDPLVWYGVASSIKLPDFPDSPNMIGVIGNDAVASDRTAYISDKVPLEQASIKIVVRGYDANAALDKITSIARGLEQIHNYPVSITSDNVGYVDELTNTPLHAEKRVIQQCTRLSGICDRGLDSTGRRYLFDIQYQVRFI
jgi:hypothetical protein